MSTGLHSSKASRRILVCVDRSPFSEGCVPQAVALARAFDAAITLLHVVQPGQQKADALSWEISRQEGQEYLERLQRAAEQALGRPVDVRLEQGSATERIVDVARESRADFTVLGSRRDLGPMPWALGGTVGRVLASTRSSVLVVHPTSTARPPSALGRVLVPLDGSPRTESALPAAARLAHTQGAELLLVHVVYEPLPTASFYGAAELKLAQQLAATLESSAKRYLERLQRRLGHGGDAVRTLVVRHPNERRALLEVVQRENVDLVVLSAHGATCDSSRPFGSVTTHLLTHSAVPLLVLQDLPERETVLAHEARSPFLRGSYSRPSPGPQ